MLTFGNTAYVNAGSDIFTCETADLITLTGLVSGETTTGIWSSSGDGIFFPSANVLNTFYEPGVNDIANGSTTLTLTSTGSSLCEEGSSSIVVNYQSLPIAAAGVDQVICGSIGPVQLIGSVTGASGGTWTTTGTGLFTPSASILTPLYIPTQADSLSGSVTLTLTTTGNGNCESGVDQMTIFFSGAIGVNAGVDQGVCETMSSIDLSGAVVGTSTVLWSSSGNGTFSPSASVLNPTYNFGDTDNGQVTLYLIGSGTGNCPPKVDSLLVTIDPLPVITVPSSVESCSVSNAVTIVSSVQNADAVLWSSSGGGTFTPSNSAQTVTYTATAAEVAAGQANISLAATSNGACGTVQQAVQILFKSPAIVNAGTDVIACSTEGQVDLQGVIQGTGYTGVWSTNSFGTFSPNTTTLNASYLFGDNDILIGSARLILTSANNGPCPAVADTVDIVINKPAIVEAGNDMVVCQSAGSIVFR